MLFKNLSCRHITDTCNSLQSAAWSNAETSATHLCRCSNWSSGIISITWVSIYENLDNQNTLIEKKNTSKNRKPATELKMTRTYHTDCARSIYQSQSFVNSHPKSILNYSERKGSSRKQNDTCKKKMHWLITFESLLKSPDISYLMDAIC